MSNLNKNCFSRDESAGIATLRNYRDKFLSIFNGRENSDGTIRRLQLQKNGFTNYFSLLLRERGHPNSRKNAPRMEGQMKIFHVGFHQFGESLRELLRELWFSHCSSPEMPFRERNFVFRELEFRIPRVAPRMPRNAPRAPRMAFSLRERFFLKLGVVPRLLKYGIFELFL